MCIQIVFTLPCLRHSHTHTLGILIYSLNLSIQNKALSYSKDLIVLFKCMVIFVLKGIASDSVWQCLSIRMAKKFLIRRFLSLWLKFLTFSLGKYTHEVYCFTLKALKHLWKLMTSFWRRLYKQTTPDCHTESYGSIWHSIFPADDRFWKDEII